jgi:hypothetical protein
MTVDKQALIKRLQLIIDKLRLDAEIIGNKKHIVDMLYFAAERGQWDKEHETLLSQLEH